MGVFVPQSLRIWISMFYFLLGGLFGSKNRVFKWIDRIPVWVLFAAATIMGVVCNFGQKHMGVYIYQSRLAEFFYDELCVMVWCFLIFAFLLRVKVPEKMNGVIISFSKLSLGVFIIHPLLLKASEIVFTPDSTIKALLLWGVIAVASTVISWVISKIPYVRKLIEL